MEPTDSIFSGKEVSVCFSFSFISDKTSLSTCGMNLVAVAQIAVALPAAGTGSAEARGGLRHGEHRRVLVLTADEFGL